MNIYILGVYSFFVIRLATPHRIVAQTAEDCEFIYNRLCLLI